MNEIVDVVSTTTKENELIMKQVVSSTNNDKHSGIGGKKSNEDVLAAADKESVTVSSCFSKDDGNVESLSHVSSLVCFEVESSTSVGGGGLSGCYDNNEVEQQQPVVEDSSPWDVDTSEQVYLSSMRETRATDNIPESGRNHTGKRVEDGISKESNAPSTNAGPSRLRSNKNVAYNTPINLSVRQGCTGGVSISNAMQFKENCAEEESIDRIDSALLSALNDPKERMGLLRLEKVLIEFMNDRSIMYMDVGGPNNSIVIKENAQRSYVTEDGSRGRQTSFQRLCLHRLADRFNIARESLPSCDDYYMGTTPSLIRLVKMNDSMIPSKLLIDLSKSYSDVDLAKNNADSSMRTLTNSLSTSSLNATANDNTIKQEKPRRKMKIMKRRSGDGSGNSNDGKDRKNQNKNKGKKLSEKEKAYAEARARIFNELEEKRRAEGLDTNAVESPNREINASPSPSSAKSDKSGPLEETLVYEDTDSKANASSKVTWRNRRQEENDPDFRRGNVVRAQQNYVTPHGVFVSPPLQSSGAAGANYVQTVLTTDTHPTPYKQSSSVHYPSPQQQMYYPSPQVNSTPYVQQQQPYYPHSNNAQYYAQQSNQSRSTIRQQPHLSHQMLYSSNTNNANASRKENIVYSMEEFPPIG